MIPRQLKRAIERVHSNSGHPPLPALLHALHLGNATVEDTRAARLYMRDARRCVQRPKLPKPNHVPSVDEFNVLIGADGFEYKDADGNDCDFLDILRMGTNCDVVCYCEDNRNL